jgi:hypothetical protein
VCVVTPAGARRHRADIRLIGEGHQRDWRFIRIEEPDTAIAKVVCQSLVACLVHFMRPDNTRTVDIGVVEDHAIVKHVVRAVADQHQMIASEYLELLQDLRTGGICG